MCSYSFPLGQKEAKGADSGRERRDTDQTGRGEGGREALSCVFICLAVVVLCCPMLSCVFPMVV